MPCLSASVRRLRLIWPCMLAQSARDGGGGGAAGKRRWMSDWILEHTEPYPQKPYIFYAAFLDQEVINKLEEDHDIPAMMEIAALPAAHFRSGQSWEKLREERPKLAEAVEASPLAVALHGSLIQHESLQYLKDSVTVMASLLAHGAVAVYDPLTLSWYGPAEWIGADSFNPFDHVTTLSVPDGNGGRQLRTRGLRKFGRPDLVVPYVAESGTAETQRLLDRLIDRLARGGVLAEGETIAEDGWQAVPGAAQGGLDDPEFHNFYQTVALGRT